MSVPLAQRTISYKPCCKARLHICAALKAPQSPAPPRNPSRSTAPKPKYQNSWHRKEVDISKQVVFRTPLRPDAKVAIIGGGISGLICAEKLAAEGCRVTVYDTGEHGVGGRLATRASADASLRGSGKTTLPSDANLKFDHAAQYFTVTDPRFRAMVDEWLEAGAVREWTGEVGTLAGGSFTPLPPTPVRYVSGRGMRGLAEHVETRLLERYGAGGQVQVKRPLWVARMDADLAAGGWKLSGRGRQLGTHDVVVIAHNGKCANRLVGPTGAPLVARQLMTLRLSAIWALMVAFDGPLPSHAARLEGAFVEGSKVLAWVANNSAKLALSHRPASLSCWTLFSTGEFGRINKVPQESIPAEVEEKVTKELLQAFATSLGVSPEALPPAVFTRCQLWGAALPTNSPGVDCILDPHSRVGVCGDWLLGGSMQAAAVSGAALAEAICGLRGAEVTGTIPEAGIGLDAGFRQFPASDIGEFPS